MMESLFPAKKIYRVSELTQELNQVLETEFKEVWVQGEISGFHQHKSGHYFFALKDESSKLEAVMFKFQALYLKFTPEDGLEIIARGRLNFYSPRGELRLIVDSMEPVGLGALQLAFEQLKKKLAQEGLFDPSRKKPIPEFCRRIAVITSPTGAVFQDILKIFRERKTRVEILLIPSRVQGEGAEQELANALALANQPEVANPPGRLSLDLIVLARGGGSLEDLWPFNTELLARAIAQSQIPVMSAVGHEVDYTIADLVADARAPTPTAAAERIAGAQETIFRRLQEAEVGLESAMRERIEEISDLVDDFMQQMSEFRSWLNQMDQRLMLIRHELRSALREKIREMQDQWLNFSQKLAQRSPLRWLQMSQEKIFQLESNLIRLIQISLNQNQEQLSHLIGSLQALSPLATLGRGYSIVRTRPGQKVITDQKEVKLNDQLEVILHKGELGVRVEDKKEKSPWEDYEPEEK